MQNTVQPIQLVADTDHPFDKLDLTPTDYDRRTDQQETDRYPDGAPMF